MATIRLMLAIEAGLKGAVAALADEFPRAVLDMPTMEVDGRTEIDACAISALPREQRAAHLDAEVLTCIERVRAVPAQGQKQGAQSPMNFGNN